MPYIKKEDRARLAVDPSDIQTAGELNYYVTMVIQRYVRNKGLCYQTINDITGALENCKLEFYRRVVSSYEQEKIKSNGDVY